jgi:hypothetical protein
MRNLGWAVAAAVVVVALMLLAGQRQGVEAQQGGKGQQWEYLVVSQDSLIVFPHVDKATAAYNKLRADGWEFSGIEHKIAGAPPHFVFKRPKK